MSKLIQRISKYNTWQYNHLKAIEELTELQQELIKKVTKRGGPKEPPDQAVVDEIGDVFIRIQILSYMYPGVPKRIKEKLTKLEGYLKEGKYKGSI